MPHPRVILVLAALLAAPLAGCLDAGDGPEPSTPTSGGSNPPPASVGGVECPAPGEAVANPATPGKPRATIETSMGNVVVELERERAPVTVGNFVNLSGRGFYDGTTFHRVIGPSPQTPQGFMIQGGDPNSKDTDPSNDGRGGPGYQIPDEFHPALRHDPFVISMANSGPNTGGSQFFITMTSTPWLDDKHAVFGRVVEGQGVIRAIGDVETDQNDRPTEPVVVHSITVEEPAEAGVAAHDVGAHVVVKEKKTEAGRPVTFVVVATNKGNVRDALAVRAEAPEGWLCAVEGASQSVPAGTARVFLVTLRPPAGATGAHDVTMHAWSLSDPAKTASATAKVELGALGKEAKAGSNVQGNYVGMLIDGRLFDTSIESVAKDPNMGKSATWGTDDQHRYAPFDFQVGGGVIQGFSELATGAKEGETRAGRMPPAKAYGERGHDLAGKTLIFELQILKVT